MVLHYTFFSGAYVPAVAGGSAWLCVSLALPLHSVLPGSVCGVFAKTCGDVSVLSIVVLEVGLLVVWTMQWLSARAMWPNARPGIVVSLRSTFDLQLAVCSDMFCPSWVILLLEWRASGLFSGTHPIVPVYCADVA